MNVTSIATDVTGLLRYYDCFDKTISIYCSFVSFIPFAEGKYGRPNDQALVTWRIIQLIDQSSARVSPQFRKQGFLNPLLYPSRPRYPGEFVFADTLISLGS